MLGSCVAGSRRALGCLPLDDDGDEGEGGAAAAKWSRAYDTVMDPFHEFKARERDGRLRAMPVHDRCEVGPV
jgi:hypothetical protein